MIAIYVISLNQHFIVDKTLSQVEYIQDIRISDVQAFYSINDFDQRRGLYNELTTMMV